MNYTLTRIRLPNELHRKYKVFCAINNMNMTQMTEHILREYIKKQGECIKIIRTKE